MNEQEQFEAWVNSLNPGWLLDKTKNDGDYAFPRAYAGWQAWQAAIATQQARIEALEKGLQAVAQLIEESSGVSGLHMNGDVAPWSDLQTGGRFEEWLVDFDAALLQEPTK